MAAVSAALPASSAHARGRADTALGALLLVVVGALTVAPVLYVFLQSFNTAAIGEPYRFGFVGWREAFDSPKTLSSIGYSFLLSVRIPIGIAVAFLFAWLLVRVRIPCHAFIERALWFTFFLPTIPMTMGWILLLDSNYGLVNQALQALPFVDGPVFSIYSVTGILWVHLTLSTIPIMVILLAPALRQLDAAFEEAADVSGAGTLGTLMRITIPMVAPALLTAFVAGLIRSLEVFEIERLIGTPANIFVYATRVFDLVTWYPPLYPQAMALSTVFLGVLIIVAVIYQSLARRVRPVATLGGKSVRLEPRVRRWWGWAAAAALIAYLGISVGAPLVMLVAGSFTRLFGFFFMESPWTVEHWLEVFNDPSFVRATVNSVMLGLAAGTIGTLAFALLAWVLVRSTVAWRGILNFMTWLPWAIPGVVLGVTLLSLMLETPIVSALYGTLIPLVLAIIIKELPIGVQMLKTAISQVSGELEEAARMTGAGFAATFYRILLPLMTPMLIAVFLLVFMSTVRDISSVVLLATPGTRTLSLLMFEFATSNRFESAAVIGVLIALISLVITSLAFKAGGKLGIES